MKDIIFFSDQKTLVYAKKQNTDPLYASRKEARDHLFLLGGLVLAQATKDIRVQVEQNQADVFFGLEILPQEVINHILLSLIFRKRKIVLLLFRYFLSVGRAEVLESTQRLIPLFRKYKIIIALASGAENRFQLRSLHDISSFFSHLGMTPKECSNAFTSIPEHIIENAKKKERSYSPPGLPYSDFK